MKIVADTNGYEVDDVLVVDVVSQPNFFKSRLEELKGRMTGETKDFYSSLMQDVIKQAKNELFESASDADAISNVRITPYIKDIRGDVFVGATAQAYKLRKEK